MRMAAALVVIAVVTIVAVTAATAAGRAHKRELTAARQPIVDHERAVRLLDRIVAADEVLPSLPTDLVREAQALITRHYGEEKTK